MVDHLPPRTRAVDFILAGHRRPAPAPSGGIATIASATGEGTTVATWLPKTPADAEPAPDPATEPAVAGGETILVVEDDARVRAFAARVLAGFGYATVEAGDANAAYPPGHENLAHLGLRRSARPAP